MGRGTVSRAKFRYGSGCLLNEAHVESKYGKMAASVTPNHGRANFEGIPIFDTVEQAGKATGANASVIL